VSRTRTLLALAVLAAACAVIAVPGVLPATAGAAEASPVASPPAGELSSDLESSAPATSTPTPSPSPTVSGTLVTTVLGAVTVPSGSSARVRYRADDTAGGTVTVDLLVTTRAGDVVKRLVTGRVTAVGVMRVWRGRLRLPPGSYLLVAHAVDAGGLSESSTRAGALRVLAPLPPLVPTARARRAAFAWAARRAGSVAVAVVDSRGRLYGYHASRPFITASVVKAMLLVAYLRRHSSVGPAMRTVLARMITLSDNDAADEVYRLVGRGGLAHLAHLARMRTFRAGSAWIVSRVGAADMARFFRDMERYIPAAHRRFADSLLTHIVSYERWGIPPAAEPLGYRVYFKPGWLGAWVLANEAARLERKRVRIGLAVFTDGNPTSSYGKETIAGVTARLLRQ
jgi:Beta-lactamase enzyme family